MPDERKALQRLATLISKELPEGTGFFLSIFKFGEPGRANYISNARRQDAITAMRETAYRLEHKQDEGSMP